VPAEPRLREVARQRLVGRALARVDVPAKVDGTAVFGIDFALPGMLVAAVKTMPLIGGELQRVDTRRAAREPGQAYVAVSRVRSLAGLNFKEWFKGVHVSPEAIEFYQGKN
jgi:isoquinoline 1-oxidoreductase beta subunit